eukprot:GSMAST32.ASY1.ANO1.2038.1 assembled CDS
MLRLAPQEDPSWGRGQPSSRSNVVFSLGGDEMNVAVALHVVFKCAEDVGVGINHVHIDPKGEMGIFYVLPDEKRVQYQRRTSSFWVAQPNFNWYNIFTSPILCDWVHATGITPLCGVLAQSLGLTVSIDLNHRPALGTLSELWKIVSTVLYIFIISNFFFFFLHFLNF